MRYSHYDVQIFIVKSTSFLCHELTHFWEPTFNNSFCMRNYHVYCQQIPNCYWYYTIFEKILNGYRIFHFSYCTFNFSLEFPHRAFCRIFICFKWILFFKKFLLNFTLCSFYKPQVLATRHMENISNSNRWNTNVISFINMSMNGFIVEEWNSVLVTEASIQLLPCFTSSCTTHFNEQNSFNDIPRLFETFQMNWIYILIN